jgi:hypothetical protein
VLDAAPSYVRQRVCAPRTQHSYSRLCSSYTKHWQYQHHVNYLLGHRRHLCSQVPRHRATCAPPNSVSRTRHRILTSCPSACDHVWGTAPVASAAQHTLPCHESYCVSWWAKGGCNSLCRRRATHQPFDTPAERERLLLHIRNHLLTTTTGSAST